MDRKSIAALTRERNSEATDELVGVLTAISVVSKRLAKKLTLLEKRSANGGEQANELSKRTKPTHAG